MYKPAIAPDEKVTYSECGTCGGLGFYAIERYMDESDRRDLKAQAERGFIVRQATVKSRIGSEDCVCPKTLAPARPEASRPSPATSPSRPTGKPVLSLSVRKRSN